MSRKGQSYQNRGRGLLRMLAMTFSMFGNVYSHIFHNNQRNAGKAGGHLDTSYHSGGGSGGNTKVDQKTRVFKSKYAIEKKRRRKEVQSSQRINRKRKAGVCSFK
jgi:hypothetical protein